MPATTTIILLIILIILLTAIIALWIWYKKEMHRKNNELFRHIDNERELEEVVKREKIEKETLMKMIKQLKVNQ